MNTQVEEGDRAKVSEDLGGAEPFVPDPAELERLVAERYLSVQRHPGAELWIYNYTPRAQYQAYWTPTTLACRGLILDADGGVVARPFPKFFNLSEHVGPLPAEPFEAFDKLDGSLGILYHGPDGPSIATRGSFTGAQAQRATELLRARYADYPFDPRLTYLFEIIYPENRIVVNYGAFDDLVLLAIVETSTGLELPLPAADEVPFPVVARFDGIADLDQLRALHRDNAEGFVIRFQPSGLRLKVKLPEYLRIHRLLTGVSERRLWEMLRAGEPLELLLEAVPDEFSAWVTAQAAALQERFDALEVQGSVVEHFDERKQRPCRSGSTRWRQRRGRPSWTWAIGGPTQSVTSSSPIHSSSSPSWTASPTRT